MLKRYIALSLLKFQMRRIFYQLIKIQISHGVTGIHYSNLLKQNIISNLVSFSSCDYVFRPDQVRQETMIKLYKFRGDIPHNLFYDLILEIFSS